MRGSAQDTPLVKGRDGSLGTEVAVNVGFGSLGGLCINNSGQHIGRSRRGLTSKIHVVVDGNGLPVRLGLTGGQVHDNRLCSVLLNNYLVARGCWRIAATTLTGSGHLSPNGARGRTFDPSAIARTQICFSPYLSRPLATFYVFDKEEPASSAARPPRPRGDCNPICGLYSIMTRKPPKTNIKSGDPFLQTCRRALL